MDSFINNPDMVEFPTNLGWYWFWGYRYGTKYERPKELILCKLRKISNGTMLTGNGQFVEKSEIEEAMFIPATLPELPEGDKHE